MHFAPEWANLCSDVIQADHSSGGALSSTAAPCLDGQQRPQLYHILHTCFPIFFLYDLEVAGPIRQSLLKVVGFACLCRCTCLRQGYLLFSAPPPPPEAGAKGVTSKPLQCCEGKPDTSLCTWVLNREAAASNLRQTHSAAHVCHTS